MSPHLCSCTFYHLHPHGKLTALNQRAEVFLLLHVQAVTRTHTSIHAHTVIIWKESESLLYFAEKEASTQNKEK